MANELGASHVLIGADMNPLAVVLRNAQRVTNSAMAQMTTSVQQFSGAWGKAMKLGVGVGVAGLAAGAGGAALAVGNLLSQVEALKFFAREVGRSGGTMKQALPEFDAIHERLAKQIPLTRAAGLEMVSFSRTITSSVIGLTMFSRAVRPMMTSRSGTSTCSPLYVADLGMPFSVPQSTMLTLTF